MYPAAFSENKCKQMGLAPDPPIVNCMSLNTAISTPRSEDPVCKMRILVVRPKPHSPYEVLSLLREKYRPGTKSVHSELYIHKNMLVKRFAKR